MLVRFWGTRGSVPVPGPATVRHGGNTSCVQVRTASGTQLILDCGTGIRELGLHLSATLPHPIQANILLSHTHWDHIQGMPFFVPAHQKGNSLTFYAARGMNAQLREVLTGQMVDAYFPIGLDQLRADISYQEIAGEAVQIGDAIVQALYLNHTTVCLGYRINADGASVVYTTDHEPYTRLQLRPGGEVVHFGDRRLITFVQGVDLLIHDAQYTDEEYPAKLGWGHSTFRYAACIALAAGVKRLALFHHDPGHSDEFLDAQEERVRVLLANSPSPPEVFAAAEGQEFRLAGPQEVMAAPDDVPVAVARAERPPRILIADDDRMILRMVQAALRDDSYEVLVAHDGQQALALALSEHPDLLIVDAMMPGATGFEVCYRLRQDPEAGRIPILLLTALDDPQHISRGFKEGASDYITKPFTGTLLRSRVRSWLVRSGVL